MWNDGQKARQSDGRKGEPALKSSASADSEPLTPAERAVLDTVTCRDGISRAEIADSTGIPLSTVSAAVRRLGSRNLVEERTASASTGGRPPRLIHAPPAPGTVLAAELGTAHAHVGVVGLDGAVIRHEDVVLDPQIDPETCVQLLERTWGRIRSNESHEPRAIALAVPGPVDQQGTVTGAARMPGWNGFNVRTALERRTGLPAVIENDARAATVGEWVRRDRPRDSLIYVKAGRGIGGGWTSGGIVHRGSLGFAGELTHNRVETTAPRLCSCGNRGCLETVASGAALLRTVEERGRTKDDGQPMTTSSDLVRAVHDGDPEITALVRAAGGRLGEVLSGLVNFLNPARVVIGGSLSQMPAFIAATRSEIYDRCLPIITDHLAIEASRAAEDAAIIGLSALASTRITQSRRTRP